MTKTLLMATAAAWWCLVAAAIHSPPTANAQEVARTNARAVLQTDPQVNAQVDAQSNALATAQVDPQINAQVTEHRLTLFHTNDLRGEIYNEEGFDEADLAENQGPENAMDRGGLAALVSMIRAHARAGGASTLVLDGGNAIGATPACDVDGCRTLIQLMGMAGFDAMVVGGHEFAYGLDTLLTRADQADFPLLGAVRDRQPCLPR